MYAIRSYYGLMALGRGLGHLARPLLKSRVKIARRNLELAFPEWSEARREQVLRITSYNVCYTKLLRTTCRRISSPSSASPCRPSALLASTRPTNTSMRSEVPPGLTR